jgi:LysM repeat protein
MLGTFPSDVLSTWYSLLSYWRQQGGQAGLESFTDYLNGAGNQVIRAYVAGTTGQGHQAATANILRRLFMPLGGFDYTGLVEVYCDGGADVQAKFRALLPELTGAGPSYGFYGGNLQTFQFNAAQPPAANVNLGFTGGADDDIHYAAGLNANYFLRLQPYRWPYPQQVQFLSTSLPYVNLELQRVLGFNTLVERAYAQPLPPINWDDYQGNQRAEIVQWVLSQAAETFGFMPVYGVRRPAFCEMGNPAQDRIVEICGGVMAAQTAAGAAAMPALLLNLDVFEPNDEFNFARVSEILAGGPTNTEQTLGTMPQNDPHYNARRVYFQGLNSGADRFDSFLYDPAGNDNLTRLQTQVAAWLAGHDNRVLWVQLGRSGDDASLLPPPIFNAAFAGETLPGVFEGQNTANLMLNVGKAYFHVNQPDAIGVQYPTKLLGLDGQAAVPRQFQTAADQLHAPLGEWPVAVNDNPVAQVGAFIEQLRLQQQAGHGDLVEYLADIQNFYGDALNDKFGLVLTFLNYLINGQAQQQQLMLLTSDDSGDTLAGLYKNFSEATEPVMFAAQLDPNGQICKFVVDMQKGYPGSPFSLTGVRVEREPATGDQIDTVTLNGETELFGSTNTVKAIFAAPEGPVTLDCRFFGPQPWSPDGVPWMGFAAPFIGFNVADGDIPACGTLGGTLIGPNVAFEVQLPPTDNQLCFTGVFNSPPSIAGFYSMVGGINLVATLPPPLNVIAALKLQDVRFAYDTEAGVVSVFAFDLGWSANSVPIKLFGTVSLNSVAINITVTQPGAAASLMAVLASSFTIGTGLDAGVVSIAAVVPDLVFDGELTSGEIKLPDLLGMFLPGFTLNPPSTPTITQFSFSCAQKTGAYSMACQLGFDWTISLFGTPVLTINEVGIQADYVSSAPTGRLSGSITLLPADPLNNLTLLLAADYLGETSGWRFSGEQDPDKQQDLSLNYLIKTYLGPDWALPGGDYRINGLKISTAPTVQTYTIAGKTAKPWEVPFLPGLTISAEMNLGYAPPAADLAASPVLGGELAAVINWYSVTISLAWKFGEGGAYTYIMDWGALHAEVSQNAKEEWVATGSLQNQTLGGIVEEFVSYATGSRFGLTAPWDLLNSVPLGVFEVTFNFTTKTMGLNVEIGPINLGFATIDKIGVVYDPSETDRKVMIEVIGSFAWTSDSSLDWDAAKPETAPAPPGGGNKYVDLRLLALGQHVGLVGAPDMKTVSAAINALRNLGPDDAPITKPNKQVYFDPSVAWLVGMDFGLMRVDDGPTYTLQLSTVFDDPLLYGLRVALDGPAAKVLAGLSFEILYRRISDTVGVYQGELTLPTAMRTIDVGAYTLTFPTFSLAVYTNGDFLADIGFPWNLDFSRSFTVQAIIPPGIPVLGSAGFYFGKLSSATTDKVPAASNGQFNPVIVFGFGIQVGFGKEVNYGILSAGFSLTVFGIIEGVIAKWCPNVPDGQSANALQLQTSYYFWLQGTFGVLGRLYGSVDFAVVKASVDVRIAVMAQITYESYHDIPISVIASVDVRASLKINLGIFSITLHFSFSLTIKETFTIHNPQQPSDAPWQVTSQTVLLRSERMRQRLRSRMAAPAALTTTAVSWTNLLPAATPAHLTSWLAPALTVSAEGATTAAQQKTAYVALVALESVDPSADPSLSDGDTAFELLAKQVLRWLVAAIQSAPVTSAQVDALIVTDDELLALSDFLSDATNPVPISVSAIETFMQDQFVLDISLSGSGQVNATPFPMPPELILKVPAYNGSQALSYSFADFNSTSAEYLNELRTYFDALAVIVQPKPPPTMLMASDDVGMSVGSFLFADQFRLIAKQMIEACRTALRDFTYPIVTGQTSQMVVDWVNTTGGLTGTIAYTGAELFAANSSKTLTQGALLSVAGATLSAPAGATFTSLATAFGSGLTAAPLATANAVNTELLVAGAVVKYPGKPDYTVQPRDTLNIVAAVFGVSLADIFANSEVLTQKGLIVALSALTVPQVSYTAAAGDTLTTVSQRFGVPIEDLATSANLAVATLFSPTEDPTHLSIPHLPQFQVAALISETQGTGQIAQLAGMAGRYSLHGLRLPTDGVTPKQPCMCGNPLSADCPMYALSGQQFATPTLTADPFGFSLTKPAGMVWITLNGGDSLNFVMGDWQAAQAKALQTFLTGTSYAFNPQISAVRAEAVYADSMTTWSVGAPIAWACAGAITLPYGTPLQGQPSLRLWPLPAALLDLYDSTRDAPPRIAPVLGVYNEASGAMDEQPIGAYAWAMQVGVTVKKRLDAGSAAGACTYELVGVGESQITLLERFLSWANGSSTGVLGFDLLYPGQPAAGASGLQSYDPATLTWGIIQVNLSTVTHPPQALATEADAVAAAAPQGPCFNNAYDFVKLLWECSITRSGGYYLYYCDGVSETGLPDAAFNDKGEADLSLVLRASAPAETAEQNLLPGFLNTLVTGAPFETANASVFTRADPVASTLAATSTDTLASIGVRTYTDPLALAEDNAGQELATGAKLTVMRGLYVVGPAGTQPGGAVADIANWFGTTVPQLEAANQQIKTTDWSKPLDPGVALRLPQIDLLVGTSKGGNKLGSLGDYYGCGVDGLAADNQDAPGLLTGMTLDVRGGPSTRTANTPPGSVTIEATRTAPAPIPAPTDLNFARLYLESAFTLLGYGLEANAWFKESLPGLPISSCDPPTDPSLATDRRRRPMALTETDDAPLNYSRVVPVSRYALTTAALASTGPDPKASPYRGLGGIAQLNLYWLDSFGNKIIGDLGQTLAGATAIPPALPLLYTDPLIGLAQWSGVAADYRVVSESGAAEMQLCLTFDPTVYQDPTPDWKTRASQALGLYNNLYFQLAANFEALLRTSLLKSGGVHFTVAQVKALQDWLYGADGVYAFLSAQASGDDGTAPAALTLTFPLENADLNPAELFEVTVSVAFSRPEPLLAAAFVDAAGVKSVANTIAPAFKKDPNAGGDRTLNAFAADFETALSVDGKVQVKLATGVDRREAVDSTRPLWLTRLAPGPGLPPAPGAAGFTIENTGAPVVYAPRPSFNTLQAAAEVPIYDYDSGMGIDFEQPSRISNFGSVDVDVWLGQMLDAVDTVLGPDLSASAALVDLKYNSHNLTQLLDAKESLAGSLSAMMIPVYDGEDPSQSARKTAQEAFRQQLLQTLASFYAVSAAVQFEADVVAEMNEPQYDAPALYGSLVPAAPPAVSDPGVSLTSAKLPLATTPSGQPAPLTFLASSRNGRDASGALEKAATLNLVYRGLQIEHQIGALPNIEGYLASSWLSFVLPPQQADDDTWPLAAKLGTFDIPLVLRAYPTPPTMVNQAAQQLVDGAQASVSLSDAVLWNYSFVFSQSFHYPQDAVEFVSSFNMFDSSPNLFLASGRSLTADLAEFVTVYPAVAADLIGVLATVDNSTTDAKVLNTAKIALLSFVELVARVADDFVVQAQPSLTEVGPGEGQAPYQFSLTEGSVMKTNPDETEVEALLVTMKGLPPDGINTPRVDIDGYTTHRTVTDKGFTFTYTDKEEGDYLLAAKGQTIPRRTICLPGLNILAAQNAVSSAAILRNQNLVEGKVTAQPFVYQTSPVSFATPLRPTLTVMEEIDIAAISTGSPVPRSLVAQLGALFDALFAKAPSGPQQVQLAISYSVSPNPKLEPVQLPVAFLPPIAFMPSVGQRAEGDPISQTQLTQKICDAINAWYKANAPQTGGELRFEMKVMARQSAELENTPTSPLLDLSNLVLHFADWADPPGQVTISEFPGTGLSSSVVQTPHHSAAIPAVPAAGSPNSGRLRPGQLNAFKQSLLAALRQELFAAGSTGQQLWEDGLVSRLLTRPSSVSARTVGLLALIETPEAMEAYLMHSHDQGDAKRRAQRCIKAVQEATRLAAACGWLG